MQKVNEHQVGDNFTLALAALGWVLADPARAQRLLDMTGLTPSDLRSRVGDSTMLAATLRFLEAYEPDLIACAASLDIPPARIVAAREALEQ